MSFKWSRCLTVGLVIVLVDLATVLLTQQESDQSTLYTALGTLDNMVNIFLFGYVGFRTGQETARATPAAEAGVATSLLPALVATLVALFAPQLLRLEAESGLVQQLVQIIALNIVLGGVAAWIGGLIASRAVQNRR
jgi:hypothetical protein